MGNIEKDAKKRSNQQDQGSKGKKPLKIKKQQPQVFDQPSIVVSSSPHITKNDSVKKVMWSVFIVLLPAAFWGIYQFRSESDIMSILKSRALYHLAIAIITCMITEAIINFIRKQKITAFDGSAAVTGILLAMTLPYKAPLFVAIISSIFAIFVVKHLFGGLGGNFLNPALGGRVFAMAAWPSIMVNHEYYHHAADTQTSATMLESMRKFVEGKIAQSPFDNIDLSDLFFGNMSGSLGEISALFLLLGAIYLFIKKYITWQIPVSFIGTVFILTLIIGGKDNHFNFSLFHILSGGLILGALYMATDMVTAPLTGQGRLIFGVGCGLLTVLIRLYGGYPEGVAFAILIMNLFTSLIDRVTKPRIFGHKPKSLWPFNKEE